MLDRLPVELVQHVVRLTLPSPCHATYRVRQDTLLALCRTSRALRGFAQPALFEVVELASREQVDSFLAAVKAKELGERVRSVQLIGDDFTEEGDYEFTEQGCAFRLGSGDYTSLARSCPRVAELRIKHSPVDLAALQEFVCLQRLIITDSAADVSRPFVLPQVVELSLLDIWRLDNIPTVHAFPSLSALHIQMADYWHFKPEELLLLLPHIDAFSVYFRDFLYLAKAPARTLASSLRVLFDFDPRGLQNLLYDAGTVLAATTALRLNTHAVGFADYDYAELTTDLRCLVANLPDLAGLQHLLLPAELLQSDGLTEDCGRAFAELTAACEVRGIELVLEPQEDFDFDSLVSPAFWRRCKAFKAREEEGNGKGGEQK
ncbi:hypothetical protein JCM10213_007650 [Rhodosporidiobolus nylandii]